MDIVVKAFCPHSSAASPAVADPHVSISSGVRWFFVGIRGRSARYARLRSNGDDLGGRFGVPGQSGLIFVLVGVGVAAVAAMILRRRAERREAADQRRVKRLAVDVIRSSEQLLAGVVVAATSESPSLARLADDNLRYRAAVRGLTVGTTCCGVQTTLSEVEQARQRVLLGVAARDADFLQTAVRDLDEALESFAAASSVMVRLA